MGPLSLCPKPINHPADHVVDGDVGGCGHAPLGQGLKDQRGLKPGKASSSILSTGVHSSKSKSSCSSEGFNRKDLPLVPGGHVGKELVHGKGAGEGLDLPLLLCEARGHVQACHQGRAAGLSPFCGL